MVQHPVSSMPFGAAGVQSDMLTLRRTLIQDEFFKHRRFYSYVTRAVRECVCNSDLMYINDEMKNS